MDWAVRRLVGKDAEAYRDIRLEGLQRNPEAFGSTCEAESGQSPEQFAGSLERSYVAGAFAGDQLGGVAGLFMLQGPKMAHRANLWGVYVRPEARGAGIARRLIEALLAYGAGKVKQVHLSVVTSNEAAVRLYRNAGFEVYGTEPRSLYVNGRYFDEHLMVRVLEGTEKVTEDE